MRQLNDDGLACDHCCLLLPVFQVASCLTMPISWTTCQRQRQHTSCSSWPASWRMHTPKTSHTGKAASAWKQEQQQHRQGLNAVHLAPRVPCRACESFARCESM